MKLLRATLCGLAFVAATGLMAQKENYKVTGKISLGDWMYAEEYEITKEGTDEVERQTRVAVGDMQIKTPRRTLKPHYPAFYMGFSRLSDNPFSMNYAPGVAQMQSKSWDWGIYTYSNSVPFNKKGTIGLSYAFGFGRSSYKFTDGNYFYNDNGLTHYGVMNDAAYDETWFRYWALRLPVNIEFQRYIKNKPLFLTFGPEIEYRISAKAKGRIGGGKKQKITKNYNLNSLNVNLMAQAGYDDLGFMVKLSLVDLFQRSASPECEVYPLMVGISICY